MRSHKLVLLALALPLAACTQVDTTERCVLTRYGEVVQEQMATGLNWTPLTDATCFTMTDRNYPEGGAETISAQTADPVTIEGDVAIVYAYDPATIYQVFLDKRTPQSAEAEILNSVREGYRTALAGWTVAQIFSSNRASLADSVRAHIQRKIGARAIIRQVFVRDIKLPQAIEQARINSARQAQVLAQARQQYEIDSVNARAKVLTAEADARTKQLLAQSYASNPRLMELEAAKAFAEGLSKVCGQGVTTCIIGGSVMDSWTNPRGRP